MQPVLGEKGDSTFINEFLDTFSDLSASKIEMECRFAVEGACESPLWLDAAFILGLVYTRTALDRTMPPIAPDSRLQQTASLETLVNS